MSRDGMKHITVDLLGMNFSLRIHERGLWKSSDFALYEEVVLDTLVAPIKAKVISISERYVDVQVTGKP